GQLQRLVANHAPGDVVRLTVIRFGERRALDVALMEAPITEAPLAPEPTPVTQPMLGLQLADLDAELARQLGFPRPGGVVVSDVAAASAADRKRIGIGHRIVSIDQRPVRNSREGRSMLRTLRSGEVASLLMEYP